MQTLGDPAKAIDRIVKPSVDSSQSARAEAFNFKRKQSHLLANVVMQLARDARALILLRAQQTATQIADSIITGAQLAPAPSYLRVGLPQSHPVNH